MRSFDPRAMVIVLGVLVAGPAWASPAQDAPPSAPVVEPLDLPDRPMPTIPSDEGLLEKEDSSGGGAVRVADHQHPGGRIRPGEAADAGAAPPRADHRGGGER